MRIKTFYAKTMAEALREIKASLGPEAVLLSTKEIACRSGAWGKSSGFEVVAASDPETGGDVFAPGADGGTEMGRFPMAPADGHCVSRGSGLAETYSPWTLAKQAPGAPAQRTGRAGREPVSADESGCENAPEKESPFKGRAASGVHREMVESGVDAPLASGLLSEALESLSAGQRRSRAALVRALCKAVANRLPAPAGPDGLPEKRIVAFVGPAGVGKTTSIAKLAARLALQNKKKVLLMTLDGYRIGSIEQLRSYAGLMGLPFRFAADVAGLEEAIRENSQRDYILLDTAGRGPKDIGAMQRLADFLKESDHIERHLLLSASTKPEDMRRIADQFEFCRPDHVLFTKLDETSTPGPILNELVRSRKRFSYYTDGQRVPDDLHSVPRGHLLDLVLHRNDIAFKE